MTLCPHCNGPATMTMTAVSWPKVKEDGTIVGEGGGVFPVYRTTTSVDSQREVEAIIRTLLSLRTRYCDNDRVETYEVNAVEWDLLRDSASEWLTHV